MNSLVTEGQLRVPPFNAGTRSLKNLSAIPGGFLQFLHFTIGAYFAEAFKVVNNRQQLLGFFKEIRLRSTSLSLLAVSFK